MNMCSGVTPGTASANKVVAVNAGKSIYGLGVVSAASVECTGSLTAQYLSGAHYGTFSASGDIIVSDLTVTSACWCAVQVR